MNAPGESAMPLRDYFDQVHAPRKLEGATKKRRECFTTAIAHLERYLGAPPTLADLTGETVEGLMGWLCERGRSNQTVNRNRDSLVGLAIAAVELGNLADVPAVPQLPPTRRIEPWTPEELGRLIASAQTIDGMVADLPGRLWWPALLIPVLDLGVSYKDLLAAPKTAYRRQNGYLASEAVLYRLHPLSIEALERIRYHAGEGLLPWPWDPGSVHHILFRRFREILYRANLAHVPNNLFRRLQVTAREVPRILDAVKVPSVFVPREGKPNYIRPHNVREWQQPNRKPLRTKRALRHIVTLTANSERTLLHFFETVYHPRKLRLAARGTISSHRDQINQLASYAGHEVTVDELSDDLITGCMDWILDRGCSPATANRFRGHVLALWRYAWRKKWIETQPRDVEKLPEPKRLAEAWEVAEIGRILDAAAEAPGTIAGVPDRLWWPAFVLTAYDTGLRLAAILSLRVEDLDFETGRVFVHHESQKQKADQVCGLAPETLKAILATKPARRALLFPIPWRHYVHLVPRYKRILKAAGLPHGARDLFHKLRRSHGTHVFDAAGEDFAVESLNHSSRQVARRSYFDFRKIRRRQFASDVLPRPVWSGSGPSTIPLEKETQQCAS